MKKYIPALRFDFLTKYYDLLIKFFLPENKIRNFYLDNAEISQKNKILDFGCGTGSLALMISSKFPETEIYGLDIDQNILNEAERKTYDKTNIILNSYDGEKIPFSDDYFDNITSTLVFHHLTESQKSAIFKELYRVLKKDGEIVIIDLGVQRSFYGKLFTSIAGKMEPIDENLKGLIPEYLKNANFKAAEEVLFFKTMMGNISYYRAYK